MNIGIVVLNYGIGGAEKRYCNLFNYLLKNDPSNNYYLIIPYQLYVELKDINFNFISPDEDHVIIIDHRLRFFLKKNKRHLTPVARLKKSNFTFSKNILRFIYNLYLGIYLIFLIKRFNLNVIHTILGGVKLNKFLRFWKRNKIKIVSAFVDSSSTDINILTKKHLARNYKYADVIEVLHESLLSILSSFKIDTTSCKVAPCSFINYDQIPAPPFLKENVVLFCGRLIQEKGIIGFVQMLKKIIELDKKIKFIIIGDGLMKQYVIEQCAHISSDQVSILGFHKNPTQIMSKALIFCSLQNSSNYPSQSLIEAMACGCCIVATKVPENEKIINSSNSLEVPVGDIERLTNAILQLSANFENTVQMGLAARDFVYKHMTIQKYTDFIKDVYLC